jgi:hypothetical protein
MNFKPSDMKKLLLLCFAALLYLPASLPAQDLVVIQDYQEKSSGRIFSVADVKPHSNDAFLKYFFGEYGVKPCVEGTYTWKGISLKDVGENLTLYIIDGIWKQDKKGETFRPLCKNDMKPLKDDEWRGIRVAIFDSELVDYLAGQPGEAFEKYLTRLIQSLSK